MSAPIAARWLALSAVLALAQAALAQANDPALPRVLLDTAWVPPSGATIRVNAGDGLQSALDAAVPGDEIVLEAGAVFTGNFILRKKAAAAGWIAIRGSRMDALPASGTRVRPSDAPAMPRIVTANSMPALEFEPGAERYRIAGLEIAVAPKVPLNYMTVHLGNPRAEAEIAADIIFDRVYIHGSTLCHCKAGIQLNGRRVSVIDSHISEYHGTDQDTQAILSYSGPGPFKIVNNYLEGSGENIMFGGSRALIPGLVPSDIEFRRNHLAKPVRWRSSIIPPPPSLRAAPVSGGALASGATYYYTVAAVGRGGYHDDMNSDPAPEIAVPLAAGQGGVSLSWAPVRYGDAADERVPAEYRVYRTADAPSTQSRQWSWFRVPASATAFDDSGGPGSRGAPPPGHRWMVKNLFELKNAQRVLVEGNVMEYSWQSGQLGTGILALPRTEDGTMPWAVVQDLTIVKNVIRHVGHAVVLGGMDSICRSTPNTSTCRQSSRLLVRNNLFDDVRQAEWGGRGWIFQIQDTDRLTIDRNTGINDRHAAWLGGRNSGLTITGNIMRGEIFGDGAGCPAALAVFAPDARIARNLLVEGSARNAGPTCDNFLPASFDAVGFLNYQNRQYSLSPGSPYKGKAAGGGDPGVDFRALEEATAGVVAGISPGAAPKPEIAAVSNAAGAPGTALAPGSLISIAGWGLAPSSAAAVTDPLPYDLAGCSVNMGGLRVPLVSVSPGQIVAQLPFEAPAGEAFIAVEVAGVAGDPFPVRVGAAAPGLYLRDGVRALAFNADATLNAPDNPAAPGTLLTAYLTGAGRAEPPLVTGVWTPSEPFFQPVLPVAASIGPHRCDIVASVFTPGSVGVFQVSILVPRVPAGVYALIVVLDNLPSNAGLISIS